MECYEYNMDGVLPSQPSLGGKASTKEHEGFNRGSHATSWGLHHWNLHVINKVPWTMLNTLED